MSDTYDFLPNIVPAHAKRVRDLLNYFDTQSSDYGYWFPHLINSMMQYSMDANWKSIVELSRFLGQGNKVQVGDWEFKSINLTETQHQMGFVIEQPEGSGGYVVSVSMKPVFSEHGKEKEERRRNELSEKMKAAGKDNAASLLIADILSSIRSKNTLFEQDDYLPVSESTDVESISCVAYMRNKGRPTQFDGYANKLEEVLKTGLASGDWQHGRIFELKPSLVMKDPETEKDTSTLSSDRIADGFLTAPFVMNLIGQAIQNSCDINVAPDLNKVSKVEYADYAENTVHGKQMRNLALAAIASVNDDKGFISSTCEETLMDFAELSLQRDFINTWNRDGNIVDMLTYSGHFSKSMSYDCNDMRNVAYVIHDRDETNVHFETQNGKYRISIPKKDGAEMPPESPNEFHIWRTSGVNKKLFVLNKQEWASAQESESYEFELGSPLDSRLIRDMNDIISSIHTVKVCLSEDMGRTRKI